MPRPKLIYLVPNFQNPQGTTLESQNRHDIVAFAHQHAVAIVEDDPYGALRFEGEALPDLADMEARLAGFPRRGPQQVIHIGTFSKVLAPGLRVGWVVAAAEVIDKLVQAKQTADLHTSTLCQHLVLDLLNAGVLADQVPRLCAAYRVRRDAMLGALAAHAPPDVTWTRPDGGMFLLVRLPPEIDASVLLPRAIKRNVAFVPGEDFHLDGTGRNTMRLNFSNAAPETIGAGIEQLSEVLREVL